MSNDDTLIRRYRGGEDAAATALYLRYAHRLRALAEKYCSNEFAPRFDPDDILQSVFRTFFDGVRREAYDAPTDGEVWGLLMVLALNKIRNQVEFHRAGKRGVRQTTPVSAIDHHAILARDETAAAFLRMVLEEITADLPESNRAVIQMRIEGYDVAEIVARTGRSRRTVERVLQQLRDRLTRL